MKKKSKADVVIVGGGINGCALAYNLAQRNMDVVVMERGYLSSGATGSCGAGIRQQWSTRENVELAMESVKVFEGLSEELGEDIEFRQGGYLVAVHDEEGMKAAEEDVAMQQSMGLDVRVLNPDEMVEVVPILDVQGMDAVGGTFCPSDGHANPFKTTFAYANAAKEHGARFCMHTRVVDVLTNEEGVVGVKTDDEGVIEADVVVNAAGVWSKEIAALAGVDLPNVPFRKEIMATERFRPLFEAMVISFKDGIYFSQQREGQIVGGIPIPEEREGYRMLPTMDFLQHMARTLTRYAPVLRHVNMLRHWTGFYDVTPDARPVLGEVKGMQGFVQCNGFSGHGFMLAPTVARLLSDFIVDGKTADVLQRLNLQRFEGKDISHERSVVG